MGAARKHLILVHGRSTKPSEREKRRLVRRALLHGIERSAPRAAARMRNGRVKFSLAYYGDLTNVLLLERDPGARRWLKARDPKYGTPSEEPGSYDASMAKLFARSSKRFTRRDYGRFLSEVRDRRYMDEGASLLSAVAAAVGLNEVLVRKVAPDMNAYLTRRAFASEIRTRLQRPLQRALRAGEDVCLVAHSMGCIVAYDVLWKFSHMSEYRHLEGKQVSLWLTLGNPLGEPGVRCNLLDAHLDPDSLYPAGIVDTWINQAAHDDFVAHDWTIADDFREMKRRGYLRRLVDRKRIYNFWEGFGGANPHKLYSYLDHPRVGAELGRWILG